MSTKYTFLIIIYYYSYNFKYILNNHLLFISIFFRVKQYGIITKKIYTTLIFISMKLVCIADKNRNFSNQLPFMSQVLYF
ncbi:hypothetical protein SAMN05444395_1035 [Flavobacterium fryxellicola]|nr:hypothetical protein SAMN05444395_1035 [Flavobacterium fryxellicola]